MFTELFKESIIIAAAPAYAASGNANLETGAVDMSRFNRVAFILHVGTIGDASNVNMYLQESDESDGANGTNITDAVLTSALNAANTEATIELQASQLTKRYVKAVADPGGANASIFGIIPLAFEPRYHSAEDLVHASVEQQIVTPVS